MPDGQIRYSTPISIAHGPTIEAMIDIGSVGLRVLAAADPGAMSNSASTNSPTESRYGYGSGVSLNGVDIQDDITVGRSGHIAFQSGDAQPVCALMAFDTGAPGVVIHSADIDTPSSWPVGTTATLGFANTALPKIEFVSGPPGAVTYVGWRPPEGRSNEVIASGTLIYFYYVFLYDSNGRVVGASPRSTG
jgi:hypothetical protein